MAPIGWATPAERDLLVSLIPEYEACQVKRRYKGFWQHANSAFLSKFPVIDKLFPGFKVTDLTREQKEMYTAAVLKQQQRIKEWFRWQLNPRSRSAGATLTKRDLKTIYNGKTRSLKPYEVFAKLYAKEVDDAKEARCQAQGVTGRQRLNVWLDVSKELYESASSDKKEAVRKAMNEEEVEDFEQATTPEQYLRYLKKLPLLFDATISPAVEKAGVLAFLTIVGLDPEQNGKIVCKSLQFGDKADTPVFAQVWEGHDGIYAEELARFARRHEFSELIPFLQSLHPPELCEARSLKHTHRIVHPADASTREGTPVSVTSPATQTSASTHVQAPPAESSGVAGHPQAPTPVNNCDASPEQPSAGTPDPFGTPQRPRSALSQAESDEPDTTTASAGSHSRTSPPLNRSIGPLFLSPSRMGIQSICNQIDSPSYSTSFFDYAALTGGSTQAPGGSEGSSATRGVEPCSLSQGDTWSLTEEEWATMDRTLQEMEGDSDQIVGPTSPKTSYTRKEPHVTSATANLWPQRRPSPAYFPPMTLNKATDPSPDGFYSRLGDFRAGARPSLPSSGFPFPTGSGPSQRTPSFSFGAKSSLPYCNQSTSLLGSRASAGALRLPLPFAASPRVDLPTLPPVPSPSIPLPVLPSSPPHCMSASSGFNSLLPILPPSISAQTSSSNQASIAKIPTSPVPVASIPGDAASAGNTPSAGTAQLTPSPATQDTCGDHDPIRPAPASSTSGAPTYSGIAPPVEDTQLPPLSGTLETPALEKDVGPLSEPHPQSAANPAPLPATPIAPQIQPTKVITPPVENAQLASLPAAPETPTREQSVAPLSEPNPQSAVNSAPPPAPPIVPQIQSTMVIQHSLPDQISSQAPQAASDASAGGSCLLDDSALSSAVTPSETGCRRSARGNVPSKRNEQRQLIGTNTLPPSGAESGELVASSWFSSALGHLESLILGDAWADLVGKWAALETSMGYGKVGKGSLNAMGRPEEWQKWTSKTWHGARRYDLVPQIDSAPELGTVFLKWWLSIQPSFRSSAGPFPLPVFASPDSETPADAWASLRKSGQNGFVSVMLLLAWWGNAAENTTSEWEEDSRGVWKSTVSDVTSVVEAMTATLQADPITKAQKRKQDKENIDSRRGTAKRAKRR